MLETMTHTLEESSHFATSAIERIQSEDLPCTPDIFKLFYNYYSQDNPEVMRSIDIMLAQGFELTIDRCLALYARIFNEKTPKATLEHAEKIVDETIHNVGNAVNTIKDSSASFSESIEHLTQDYDKVADSEELKDILGQVLTEAQGMVTQNQELERQLKESTEVMNALKVEMEAVLMEAYTDALTNLPNRKQFDLYSVEIVAKSREDNTNTCIIFIDIDHFKSFNDTFGHQIGDQVLRLVANTFKQTLKGRDFVCRYGGEEFVVILPQTPVEGAVKIANILRETVASKEIINKNTGDKLSRITISAGVAELKENDDIDNWVDRGDKALYEAKHNGRNCVVFGQ